MSPTSLTPLQRLQVCQYNGTVRKVLVGRNRSRREPTQGRFTRTDVSSILERTWREFTALAATAPRSGTRGGRYNVRGGVWTLALFRAVHAVVPDKEYAIELVTDVLWYGYERSMRPSRFIARLVSRDPQTQVNLMLRMGLHFPFTPPDYEWKASPGSDAFAVDFYRCPVYEYFQMFGDTEKELFRKSWCTLDFPLCEAMVEGGRYERAHTLSHGDAVCDMRWIGKGAGNADDQAA